MHKDLVGIVLKFVHIFCFYLLQCFKIYVIISIQGKEKHQSEVLNMAYYRFNNIIISRNDLISIVCTEIFDNGRRDVLTKELQKIKTPELIRRKVQARTYKLAVKLGLDVEYIGQGREV